MKKQLPTAAISNELAQSSVFFQKSPIARLNEGTGEQVISPPPEQMNERTPEASNDRRPERFPLPPPVKSTTRSSKRPNTRASVHASARTVTPNERTVQPNGTTERSTVLTELEEGVNEAKRSTERYSFEIFTDMKEKIEDIQYRYKKKTGKKLSASRIIREALEVYFQKIEEAI